MPQAARLGDPIGHTKPGDGSKGGGGGDVTGKIIGPCSGNVFTNGIKAARAHVDETMCSKHDSAPPPITTGSPKVFINGLPAARVSDKTACGAFITDGSPNVFIGGGGVQVGVTDSVFEGIFSSPLAGTMAGRMFAASDGDKMIEVLMGEELGSSSGVKGSSQPPRGPLAKNDLRFKIGDKDFRIMGGTVEQQLLGQENFKKIFATRRGAEMLKVLSARRSFLFKNKTEFVLDFTKPLRSDAAYYGDTITIDPYYVEYQLTTAGRIRATLIRLMAHELGHAVYGNYDAGKGNMDNVRRNETPIMLELGMPERLSYE